MVRPAEDSSFDGGGKRPFVSEDSFRPIAPKETAQRRRIEQYRQRLAHKRREVVQLALELDRVEAELRRFEHEYYARVGRLFLELDRVQLEIQETLYRARLLERGWPRDADRIEEQVARTFRAERRRIEGVSESPSSESWTSRREARTGEKSRGAPESERPSLRALYLALAKQYHPDKASDPEARARYEEIMAMINRAYQEGDRERLESLAATLEQGEIPVEDERALERRLYREYYELERSAQRLRRRIARHRAREMYRLMEEVRMAKRRGVDLLADLHRELSLKLEAARSRLERIREQCQALWGGLFGRATE
ncbi:MAG: hypothetical protein KatS3mg115_1505 [Candidatus Poribacteria bacterium]|nr:MAG: hypothetical protein KatS3mg115_1505 [Candidatus Poribacteria bacterium]